MKLSMLRLHDFRAYKDTGDLNLDAINLFVGPNNAGNSSILKAIHSLQAGHGMNGRDVRFGTLQASFLMSAHEVKPSPGEASHDGAINTQITTNDARDSLSLERLIQSPTYGARGLSEFPAREPPAAQETFL